MADVISIEETNKIRKSLGLPLLSAPGAGPVFKEAADSDSEEEKGSTLESRQAQAYDNYKRVQDEAKQKTEREARKEAVRKARDLAAKSAKLEGKGLGEADDQETDTRAWLIGQKKRQKKIDREREKLRRTEEELKAREEQAYTSSDLAGIRVAHELGDFEDENEHVLVLKDTTIDENEEEGDELENVNLRDQERRNERLEVKKKKPVYNPTEENEGGEHNILEQYDEVIDGKKRKRFTLDVDGQTVEQKEAAKQTLGDQVKKKAVSLDILKELPQSDYAEAKELKIRKPKKQKTKSTRKKAEADEDDIFPEATSNRPTNADLAIPAEGMEVDGRPTAPAPKKFVSYVDDDDLQASLAKQRRDALKKLKKARPEDLARDLRDQEADAMQEDEKDHDVGLVIDETTFFVDNIDERQREIEEEREAATRRKATSEAPGASPDAQDPDVKMSEGPEGSATPEIVKQEALEESNATGLDQEASFGQGIGGALGFIRGRGMWDADEGADLNEDTRNNQMFRSQKRRIETDAESKARAQRLAGRETGRYAGHSQREREEMHRKENEMRQQQESQRMARFYRDNYKPNVNLVYKDEHGRELSQKEAFKHLSHQFHGKGSGKMKTEKQLKKIDDEKKTEAKSLLDNSQMSNYSNAADATAKRRGTVGVQLGK